MIVAAELSRQRRGMEAELSSKVNTLEEEVSRLKEELGKTVHFILTSTNTHSLHGI